jgi:hypothetical protein
MELDTVANRIKERAYQIWVEAGKPDGKHAEHWEQAREEIEHDAEKKMMEDGTLRVLDGFGP